MPGRHTLCGYSGGILAVFGVLRGTHTCLVLVPMHPHTPLAGLSSMAQNANLVLGHSIFVVRVNPHDTGDVVRVPRRSRRNWVLSCGCPSCGCRGGRAMGEPLVARDRLLSCGCPGETAKIGSCRAGAPRAQDAMSRIPRPHKHPTDPAGGSVGWNAALVLAREDTDLEIAAKS